MVIKVAVDRSRCVGAGQCVRVAPDVFDQDEAEGLVLLVAEHPEPEIVEYVRKAALLCPAQAIRLEEQSPGDIP
jgi:ferredoxin